MYLANTTDIMLNGKAYYHGVRGHRLAYEAHWRIKWQMRDTCMWS